jgi:hypothetical protein
MSLSSLMLVVQAVTGYFMWWKKLRAGVSSRAGFPGCARMPFGIWLAIGRSRKRRARRWGNLPPQASVKLTALIS